MGGEIGTGPPVGRSDLKRAGSCRRPVHQPPGPCVKTDIAVAKQGFHGGDELLHALFTGGEKIGQFAGHGYPVAGDRAEALKHGGHCR